MTGYEQNLIPRAAKEIIASIEWYALKQEVLGIDFVQLLQNA
jgi:hypothetical protein